MAAPDNILMNEPNALIEMITTGEYSATGYATGRIVSFYDSSVVLNEDEYVFSQVSDADVVRHGGNVYYVLDCNLIKFFYTATES